MTRLPRVLDGIAAAVFVGFAAVQWNDPDPWVWLTAYLVPAAICAASAAGRLRWWPLPAGVGAAAFAWAVGLLPAAATAEPRAVVRDLEMHGPGVEEAREAVGLLIVAAVLASVAWRVPRRR